MSLEFNKNFDILLKKINIIAKKSNKQTGIILNSNIKKLKTLPILLPIKKTPYLICLGITIFEKKSVIDILKKIDGNVNYVLVDGEQKNKKLFDLIKIIKKNIVKSEILTYKTNDFTAESADVFLQHLVDFSKKKKIAIIGAGNIGSKLALKLVERGLDVYISRRRYVDSIKIEKALNLIKPKSCTSKVIAKTNTEIAQNCDILICFSNTPTINKKFVSQMSKNGIIIDGGIGTIKQDAISLTHEKNIKIIRLDIRAGLSGTITTLIETKELLNETMGFKKINNVQTVAGGFYGELGNVVINSISSPTEIIGIADGNGGLIREKYSLSDKKNLQTIDSWIKKNS